MLLLKLTESLGQTGYQHVTEVTNNEGKNHTVAQQCISKEFCKWGQDYFYVRVGRAFVQKREVIFPGSFSIAGNIKGVPSQLTSLLGNSASSFPLSHCNLSITPAKVQASEEAETGITCSEQVFTAVNSEFLRCSRRLKRKTKNRMVMLTSFSWCQGKWIQKRTGVY